MKKGSKMSLESRLKMSIAKKGKTSPKKGIPTGICWNKGTKDICKPNSGSFKKGKNHSHWKGEINYQSTHRWVRALKGNPSKCEMCGTTTAKKYEWANVDHKYRRHSEDWIEMCTSCHAKYDIKFNNRPKPPRHWEKAEAIKVIPETE